MSNLEIWSQLPDSAPYAAHFAGPLSRIAEAGRRWLAADREAARAKEAHFAAVEALAEAERREMSQWTASEIENAKQSVKGAK